MEKTIFFTEDELNAAAKTHALSILGGDQYEQLPDAVKSIEGDFKDGVTWLLGKINLARYNDGATLIVDERRRHTNVLGYDAARDDKYLNNELAIAAGCYALDETFAKAVAPNGSDAWPLSPEGDKRQRLDHVRKLVMAGSLIAAQIDIELRKEARQ
jgi:hypothetical protein